MAPASAASRASPGPPLPAPVAAAYPDGNGEFPWHRGVSSHVEPRDGPARLRLRGDALADALGADGEGDKEKKPAETITVVGHGKIGEAPDVAEVSVGVVTEAAAAKDGAGARTATRWRACTRRSRSSASRPRTSRRSTSACIPNTRSSVRTGRGSMCRRGSSATGRGRRAGHVPRHLQARPPARGADELRGELDQLDQFRIDDDAKLLDEARKRAIADAKHTAELLAGEAGVVLGRPIRIREGVSSVPFPIAPMGRMMAAAAPAPVAPGEVETNVTVEIVYRLLPPK